ncbi:anti-sigma factor family protein [Desulforudis sp. DRI-14]|uniref:anti-sigma factor family protein n=1 Tax=Desulforudis sp. DRI-14 TaxID=3459793 RepID=UPI0040418E2E
MCFNEGTLQAYLDGEVPESERERIARHLSECDLCREGLDNLRECSSFVDTKLALYAQALDSPGFDTESAWRALKQKLVVRPARLWQGWLGAFAVAAVFFLAVGVGLGLQQFGFGPPREVADSQPGRAKSQEQQVDKQLRDEGAQSQVKTAPGVIGMSPDNEGVLQGQDSVIVDNGSSEGSSPRSLTATVNGGSVPKRGSGHPNGSSARMLAATMPGVAVQPGELEEVLYRDTEKQWNVDDVQAKTAVELLNASVPVLEVPDAEKPNGGLFLRMKNDRLLILAAVPGDLVQCYGLSERGVILVKSPELSQLLLEIAALGPPSTQ